MWYEVLPSFSIVVACVIMPQVVTYATNRLFLGNAYKRNISSFHDAHHYLRDMRVSGIDNAYHQIGLDCFTPVEEKPPEVKIC